ncbi:DNA glycosylase [Pavlovales sp. CCMP2436]|nr:DNA glycosylase [Pavlovales sp. CCMP2436]
MYGYSSLGDRSAPPRIFRFQTLVALLLSPRQSLEVTASGFSRLRALCAGPDGLCAEAILALPLSEIDRALAGAGVQFPNNKAKYVRECAALVVEAHGGDTPRGLADVSALPGVGPKVAHLFTQEAWGEVHGIAVNSHVQRICGRLGWSSVSTVEKVRKELEAWLPREHWQPLHPLFVSFGQTLCAEVPHCNSCPLHAQGLCEGVSSSADSAGPGGRLPTEQQVLHAARLAKLLGIGLDADVIADRGACERFVALHADAELRDSLLVLSTPLDAGSEFLF